MAYVKKVTDVVHDNGVGTSFNIRPETDVERDLGDGCFKISEVGLRNGKNPASTVVEFCSNLSL